MSYCFGSRLKIFAASFLFAALFFFAGASAAPLITNMTVQEQNLWLGESAAISLNCTDGSNATVSRVWANVIGPSTILSNLSFSYSAGLYALSVPAESIYSGGNFNATAFCQSNASETASSSVSFSVSNLSAEAKPITAPVYIGDTAELDLAVRKDGVLMSPLDSSISFNLTIDGAAAAIPASPPYDTANGWFMLRFSTSSLSAGNRTIIASARYNRTSSSSSARLEAREPIVFSVANIDRTEVQSGNEIIASVQATERGNPVTITGSYLSAQVDSSAASISGVSAGASGYYNAKIVAPSFSSGTRQLKITFTYGNASKTYTKDITYVVPVSGKITGSDGKGIAVQFTFIRSGSADKTASTGSDGSYSTNLAPGNYSMTMAHDASTLELDSVTIDSFDDPIKYQYLPDLDIPGIKEAGVFVYEVALSYSRAHIRMKYDEGKVSDESKLKAYECGSWNSGKKACAGEWSSIPSSIDTIRNIARADVSSLHAYAIGTEETVDAEAGLDKSSYILNEAVKISGIARDGSGRAISGANITVMVEGTTKTAATTSGAGGVYSVSIAAPPEEGKYTAVVKIEKPPYVSSVKRLDFSVSKSREVSIVAPDVVRLSTGESSSAEFRIVNLGQADLSSIKVSIKGVPSGYYSVSPETLSLLKPGEDKPVYVLFSIPADAAKSALGASLELSGGISASKSFSLTINQAGNATNRTLAASEANSTSSFGFPTAFAALSPSGDVLYLLILAIVSFSSAIFLRKKRHGKSWGPAGAANPAGRTLLFDIKKKVVEPDKNTGRKKSLKKTVEHNRRW